MPAPSNLFETLAARLAAKPSDSGRTELDQLLAKAKAQSKDKPSREADAAAARILIASWRP